MTEEYKINPKVFKNTVMLFLSKLILKALCNSISNPKSFFSKMRVKLNNWTNQFYNVYRGKVKVALWIVWRRAVILIYLKKYAT